jgi:thiol-disulfide isomerase/thioredoxin
VAKLVPDLRNTRVLVVVWAMPGCGACDDYLPIFLQQVEAHRQQGAPFHVWSPGRQIKPGEIPVLLYDASSENEELQDFADRLKVTATPTTYVLTHWGTTKVEGAVDANEIDKLLNTAQRSNR